MYSWVNMYPWVNMSSRASVRVGVDERLGTQIPPVESNSTVQPAI